MARRYLCALVAGAALLAGLAPGVEERSQKQAREARPAVELGCRGSTCGRYGRRIAYADFSDDAFDDAAKRAIAAPSDLERRLEEIETEALSSLKDRALFEDRFWDEVARVAHRAGAIDEDSAPRAKRWAAGLCARESVGLVRDVILSRYQFERVDLPGSVTAAAYGDSLPLEQYFLLGRGDCDVYAQTAIAGFRALKARNPALRGVYLSAQDFGSSPFEGPLERGLDPHAWNTLIVPTRDSLLVTDVDFLFAQLGMHGGLVPERGAYAPTGSGEARVRAYQELGEHGASFALAQEYLASLPEGSPSAANVLDRMAFYAAQLRDPARMSQVRGRFAGLAQRPEGIAARMLYFSYDIGMRSGDERAARAFMGELKRRFPASPLAQ